MYKMILGPLLTKVLVGPWTVRRLSVGVPRTEGSLSYRIRDSGTGVLGLTDPRLRSGRSDRTLKLVYQLGKHGVKEEEILPHSYYHVSQET